MKCQVVADSAPRRRILLEGVPGWTNLGPFHTDSREFNPRRMSVGADMLHGLRTVALSEEFFRTCCFVNRAADALEARGFVC
jgi:hypothetical protein